MNIEKLKPWNWFKDENESQGQVPISKNGVSCEGKPGNSHELAPTNQAIGSFMQLHQEMDRLFDDIWRNFGVAGMTRSEGRPSMLRNDFFGEGLLTKQRANLDISGNDSEYEVSIDLPGLTEDDIKIELTGNQLVVKGQKEENKESKDKHYYRLERSSGSFQRTLSLPKDADQDSIVASMKNGLLEIHIPRKAWPNSQARRISISS